MLLYQVDINVYKYKAQYIAQLLHQIPAIFFIQTSHVPIHLCSMCHPQVPLPYTIFKFEILTFPTMSEQCFIYIRLTYAEAYNANKVQ